MRDCIVRRECVSHIENRNLDRWHRAGLLDDAARDRVLAWEAAHARPVWLWGLAGIGTLTIVLGIVAVIAANWAAIPGALKIAGHLALDLAVAGAVYAAWRAEWHRARELLAVALFGLILSGIGLIGQVYQLGGTPWQASLVWMAVCTPFLLLVTRSGLAAVAWQLGAVATYLTAVLSRSAWFESDAWMALIWLPMVTLLGLGLLRGATPGGRTQGAWIEGTACAGLLFASSLPQIMLRLDSGVRMLAPGEGFGLLGVLALVPLFAFSRRRHGARNAFPLILAAAGWLTWVATVRVWFELRGETSPSDGQDPAQLGVALVFIAFWMLVSWLALRSGRRGLFAGALAVIALRVVVFYWEAFGSLLSTGLGLLVGGLVCVALAAIGWRIVARVSSPGTVK